MIRFSPRPLLVVEIQITPGVEPNGSNSDLDHAAVGSLTDQDRSSAGPVSHEAWTLPFPKGLSIPIVARYPRPLEGNHAP